MGFPLQYGCSNQQLTSERSELGFALNTRRVIPYLKATISKSKCSFVLYIKPMIQDEVGFIFDFKRLRAYNFWNDEKFFKSQKMKTSMESRKVSDKAQKDYYNENFLKLVTSF